VGVGWCHRPIRMMLRDCEPITLAVL